MPDTKPTMSKDVPAARPGLRSVEEATNAETPRPTPTQEENDLARMGEDVAEKEDDGSGPDPTVPAPEDKKAPLKSAPQAAKPATPPPPRSTS